MKKTILYCGGFELPDRNAAAHRVMNVGKILRELGYNVIFLGTAYEAEYFEGVRHASDDVCFEMLEECRPKTTTQWVKKLHDTSNIEYVLNDFPDISAVILYNPPYELQRRVYSLTRKKNIRLIIDCTEWCADTDGSFAKRAVKKLDSYLVRNRMQKKADGLIVVSSMMEKHYLRSEKPILRLSPLVDISEACWHVEPCRSKYNVSFCFAGTVDADKDSLDVIAEAFSQLQDKNVGLDVVGVAKEEFSATYPGIRAGDNVTFYGRLSHHDTVSHILGSDFYIIARKSDMRNNAGFSTKFTEGATCGIPMLVTDVSDFAEYIGKSVSGYIIPDVSVGDIRKTVEKAICEKNDGERKLSDVFDYHSAVKAFDKWLCKVM